MINYDGTTLFISESDTQDRIEVTCTREQLQKAVDTLNNKGVSEDNWMANIAEPENNWIDVAEYNEKIGYTTIIKNSDNVLQIAKTKITDALEVIMIKHLGNGINRQCNFMTAEKMFIEQFNTLFS